MLKVYYSKNVFNSVENVSNCSLLHFIVFLWQFEYLANGDVTLEGRGAKIKLWFLTSDQGEGGFNNLKLAMYFLEGPFLQILH